MSPLSMTDILAKHILKAAPDSAKVIFENESVRVIEITMRKGQTIPMHSHDKGLSYSLNAGRIRSVNEAGDSMVAKVKKGDVSWSDVDGTETHAVENLGDTLRELCVEFKLELPVRPPVRRAAAGTRAKTIRRRGGSPTDT